MDIHTLRTERQAVIDAYGPWYTHNIALPFGEFTMDCSPRGDNYRAVKFVRLAADMLRKPFSEMRVLDLGCGEGLYALEFGLQGAEVVGVEGRPAHLAKAEFSRRVLDLPNVRFELGDVRSVSRETYGDFDLVICSGLLYHLDNPSVFNLLKTMRNICTGISIIDTSISPEASIKVMHDDRPYWGSLYREHASGATPSEKLENPGASLDNEESFWITKHDLANFLGDIGFTSVLECLMPVPRMLRSGRVTLVATVGRPVHAYNEIGHALHSRRWPELWGTIAPHPDEAGPPGR